ncbi:hypothetical protein K7432_000944 [Basidiobolus ranarum]|uniref:Cleft lip and palate transmembrane 1 n=1 Tax=Basidiobolus ranarum TaxID=34480 RepID=A0ABR2WAC9_9FUNG
MSPVEENAGPVQRKKAGTGQETTSAAQNGQEAAAGTEKPQPSTWENIQGVITRMLIIYLVFNFFKGSSNSTPPVENGITETTPENTVDFTPIVAPLWPFGTMMDLYVYTSESEEFTLFKDPSALAWKASSIEFGDWEEDRKVSLSLPATSSIQNNGTLYAHVYLTHHLVSPDPSDATFNATQCTHMKYPLTIYRKKRVEIKKKRLIGGSKEDDEEVQTNTPSGQPIVSHWYGNLTLALVSAQDHIPLAKFPDQMKQHIVLEKTGLRDPSGTTGYYFPIIFVNDFWMLSEHLSLINDTVSELPLNINFYPLSMYKFQMYAMVGDSMRQQSEMMGSGGNDMDEFKRMLIDTNPWLLGITAFVSVLHSIFDFLAFKNDITFWKEKKDVVGISVRSIVLNFVFQIIIFLYLLDNQENTSWMILFSSGIGLLIEAWKIKKAVNVTVAPVEGGWLPWKISFEDKESYTESKTKEYDQMAFTYLSYVAYPLLFGYAIYTLLYETHRSWYSWVLGTAVGFVYTFGFIAMTPQLFINYKLKSVAHMPWRTFMYKALNTFIDDLFAFVIKMPMLHRLACLRDDAVFFVYLYQRWIYPVDEKRANEFGQVGDVADGETTETKKEK